MLICKRNILKVSYSCMPNMASIIPNLVATKISSVKNKSEKPPSLFTTAYQPGFPEIKSSRTSLALTSKPEVLENYPVFGSTTALFFDLLKVCRSPEKLFLRPVLFGDRLKNFLKTFFFGKRFAPMSLASSIPVLGLERICPRKGCSWPWPRFFCVLGVGLEPCVFDSTSVGFDPAIYA